MHLVLFMVRSICSAAHAHAGSASKPSLCNMGTNHPCATCSGAPRDADPLCRACQLNALSLDIPDEMPVHDMQTDFPWAYENTAESAEMLSRVLEVHTRAILLLNCESSVGLSLSCMYLSCVPVGSASRRALHAV